VLRTTYSVRSTLEASAAVCAECRPPTCPCRVCARVGTADCACVRVWDVCARRAPARVCVPVCVCAVRVGLCEVRARSCRPYYDYYTYTLHSARRRPSVIYLYRSAHRLSRITRRSPTGRLYAIAVVGSAKCPSSVLPVADGPRVWR